MLNVVFCPLPAYPPAYPLTYPLSIPFLKSVTWRSTKKPGTEEPDRAKVIRNADKPYPRFLLLVYARNVNGLPHQMVISKAIMFFFGNNNLVKVKEFKEFSHTLEGKDHIDILGGGKSEYPWVVVGQYEFIRINS